MAKKEQNVMLLQEVVGQLRKLNAASVRDRLREAEEAKRAEKIAMQGDVQEEQQTSIVSSTEDFRRRFIAGQAKTFTDRTTGGSAQRDISRNQLLDSINKGLISPKTDSFTGLIKVNTDSLVQNLSTLKNITKQILDVMKEDIKEGTKRFNTQRRDQTEARREAINLNRPIGAGASSAAALNLPTMDGSDPDGEDDGGNTIIDNAQTAAGLGLSAYLGNRFASIKRWFGFGTKASFLTLMKGRFAALAGKIFPKSRLGFVGPMPQSVKTNPRKWPFYLAAVIAGTFLAGGSDVLAATGEDGADGSVLPPDIPDLKDQRSGFETSMDTTFAALGTAALLKKSTFVTNVAKTVGDKVAKAYSNAPKNSLRGKIYSNAGFQKGLKLGGRGLLRFLGPWGMAAWITYELVNWQMNKTQQVEAEGFAALQELNDIDDVSQVDAMFKDAELASTFSKPMTAGDKSGQKLNKAKERIKNLLKGKSQDVQTAMISGLLNNGWTSQELIPLLQAANLGTNMGTDAINNLKVQEQDRSGLIGNDRSGTGGVFNSGNTSTVSHTTINQYNLGFDDQLQKKGSISPIYR